MKCGYISRGLPADDPIRAMRMAAAEAAMGLMQRSGNCLAFEVCVTGSCRCATALADAVLTAGLRAMGNETLAAAIETRARADGATVAPGPGL